MKNLWLGNFLSQLGGDGLMTEQSLPTQGRTMSRWKKMDGSFLGDWNKSSYGFTTMMGS